MKTSDVESKTGFSKQTLIYYEKEGLISPNRDENNYRNYSEKDVQVLLLIKFLRSMNVSIDDIRLILTNQLSFQECLNNQKRFVDENIKNFESLKSTISFYKEKNIPMIPALEEFGNIYAGNSLGFRKTTKTVTIGQKLTKDFLIRKIIMNIIIAVILGGVCFYGSKSFVSYSNPLIWITVSLLYLLILIFAFQKGLGELGMLFTRHNADKYVEFNEYGLKYVDDKNHIGTALDLLKGIENMRQVNYEDIMSARVEKRTRYMKIPGSNLPTNMNTYDYYFIFSDGSDYSLINPMFLDNDRQIVDAILKEKVNEFIAA